MKLTQGDRVAIYFALFVAFFLGIWLMNDAFSATFLYYQDGIVGNGFYWMSPVQAFHVGLWLSIMAVFSATLLFIHTLFQVKN